MWSIPCGKGFSRLPFNGYNPSPAFRSASTQESITRSPSRHCSERRVSPKMPVLSDETLPGKHAGLLAVLLPPLTTISSENPASRTSANRCWIIKGARKDYAGTVLHLYRPPTSYHGVVGA